MEELKNIQTHLTKYQINDGINGKNGKIHFAVNLFHEEDCFKEFGVEYNKNVIPGKLGREEFDEIQFLTDLLVLHIEGKFHLKVNINKAFIEYIHVMEEVTPILRYVASIEVDEDLNAWLFNNLGKTVSQIAITPIQMTMQDLNKKTGDDVQPRCGECGSMMSKKDSTCKKCGTTQ